MTGLSILLLDTEPRTHNGYLVLAIADALRRHPAVARLRVAGHGEALAAFRDEGHDTLIAFGGARTHAPIVGRLAALARTSVLWTTEDPYEREANLRGSTGFDLVFSNDRASVAAYAGRAHHLPLAAAPLFHDLPVIGEDRGYLYDLLFVGTAWPNRVASLNRLKAGLKEGLKVKFALPWNEHIGPPTLDDDALVTDWRCGNRDFARLANRSRVVLTLPRAFSSARAELASGSTPPPRLFETALAGGFQVMISPEPETAEYYAADTEIALCADEDAALAAIAAALAAPARRIAAARAAQARTRAEHLYDHRVARILEAVAGHRAAPPRPVRRRAEPPVRTVLMLSHNRAGYRPGGGVEIYQEALAGLGEGYRVLFLFPVLADGHWSLRLQGPDLDETFSCGPAGPPRLSDAGAEGLFERILFEHRVDLVHIHHLLHLPLSLPLIARACGVPVIYHLHDHYLICERWLLLDHAGRFCDVVNRGSQQCDACLAAASNFPPGSKARRDGFTALVAGAVDAFVTSTPGTGAYLRGFFPEIAPERIVEIAMIAPGPAGPAPQAPSPRPDAAGSPPLTVAVLGGFTQHKGASDVVELIRTCEGYPIRFKIVGRPDEHHRGRLAGLPAEQVTVIGAYEQHAVGALLAGCDVSLHLSTWPETFVIALTEAWRAGLVPVVTALGALAERVADGIDGFTVPPHDPGAVRQRLLELHLDRGRLARMRAAVGRKRFPAVEDHLAALRGLYARLVAQRPCPHERVPDRLRTAFDLTLADLGLRVNAPSWIDPAILWDGVSAPAADAGRPDLPILHALPDAHRDLPVASLPRAETAWYLDSLRLDERAPGAAAPALACRTLALRGWLHAAGHPPRATYLRLTGAAGTAWAALRADPRQDVAERLGDPAAAASGFVGQVDLDGLPFGPYALALVQVGADRLRVWEGELPPIFAAPDRAAGRFVPERRRLAPVAPPPLAAIRQSLPEAGTVVLASPEAVWAFAAEVEAGARARAADAAPLALLVADGGRAWSAPAAWTGAHGLRFAARLPAAEPGPLALVLAVADGDGLAPLGRPIPVEIVPEGQSFRHSRGLPDGFPTRFPRKERRAPTLDEVARAGEAGQGLLRCRGWAFVAGLGAPLGAFALWRMDGPQACIAANLRRPDIAADRGTDAAMACGFEIAVPEAALARGRVRFFQRYPGRTVEYTAFHEALRRAAPA